MNLLSSKITLQHIICLTINNLIDFGVKSYGSYPEIPQIDSEFWCLLKDEINESCSFKSKR